jgi:flagellar basal-body rod protein FlgG
MIKGIYRSASAMVPRIKMQEVTANNLANASAPGFKRDMVFTKELTKAQIKTTPRKSDWQTPMIDQVYTQYDQGSLEQTENPFDIALEGDGFFVFEGTDGNTILSRAGSLTLDPSGFIVSADGRRLMGEGGAINAGGGKVDISESGQVTVDDNLVDTIRVVDVAEKNDLEKIGRTEFMLPNGVDVIKAGKYAIRQGYLETSNVNVVKEMIDMIISYRNYESDAQALKTQDDSLEKLINNVGRVR